MSNKLKSKNRKPDPGKMSLHDVANKTGVRISLLKEYLRTREEEMLQGFEEEYARKLYKSQDYLQANHILVTYLALRKAYGYTKAFGKYLDVLNEAQEEMNRRGVKEVYQEMKHVTGRDFCFDSEELNKEFGFGEEDDESERL